MKRSSSVRFGFTLIELLVVVAIVSLLVAILLPSLAKAKALARSVVCQTRQKGMANAWNMYATENKTIMYCVPGGWTGDWESRFWITLIDNYLNVEWYWKWDVCGWDAWMCPEQDTTWIGMNYKIAPEPNLSKPSLPLTMTLEQFKFPSRTVVFSDSRSEFAAVNWGAVYFAWRHPGDTANSSFVDGHVENHHARAEGIDLYPSDGVDDAYCPKEYIYDPYTNEDGYNDPMMQTIYSAMEE